MVLLQTTADSFWKFWFEWKCMKWLLYNLMICLINRFQYVCAWCSYFVLLACFLIMYCCVVSLNLLFSGHYCIWFGCLMSEIVQWRRVYIMQCLYEVGLLCNLQLLDIYCEALDPSSSNTNGSRHQGETMKSQRPALFRDQSDSINLHRICDTTKWAIIPQIVCNIRYVIYHTRFGLPWWYI